MRRILEVIFMVAIAIGSGINVFNSQKDIELSDIGMENVEALSNDETSGTGTLYGNEAGTSFCCKPGSSRTCGAATCPF